MDARYDFKRVEELAWVVLVAGGMFLAQIALTLDPDKVTDWHAYAYATAGGLMRAVLAAVVANLRKPKAA